MTISRKQKFYQNEKKQLSKTPKHFTPSTNMSWLSSVYEMPNQPGREKKKSLTCLVALATDC